MARFLPLKAAEGHELRLGRSSSRSRTQGCCQVLETAKAS